MSSLKALFKDKWLEIAIIVIGFQLMLSAVIIILGNNPVLIGFTAIVIILLIGLISSAFDVMNKRKIVGEGGALDIKRKGIIFTIGLKSHESNSPLMKVVKKSAPQYCGFIGTEKTLRADVVRNIVQAAGLKEGFYREKTVDPTNIREIREDTNHIIQWMTDKGLSKKEIVVDLTGGTAIMSIASYIAADENKVDTQYIYSEYIDNKPVDGTQKALMVSKYDTCL